MKKPPKSVDFHSNIIYLSAVPLLYLLIAVLNNSERLGAIYLTGPDSFLTTTGVVIHSQITYPRDGGSGAYFNISYDYVVDGITHESNKIDLRPTFDSTGLVAQDYMKKYPVGQRVKVYYSPNNVEYAILYPQALNKYKTSDLCAVGFGVLCIGGIVWGALGVRRAKLYRDLRASSVSADAD